MCYESSASSAVFIVRCYEHDCNLSTSMSNLRHLRSLEVKAHNIQRVSPPETMGNKSIVRPQGQLASVGINNITATTVPHIIDRKEAIVCQLKRRLERICRIDNAPTIEVNIR